MARPVALVVVAHPDDEVLGCGGTIHRMGCETHDVRIAFMTDGESSRLSSDLALRINKRKLSARAAADELGANPVYFGSFPDNQMDSVSLIEIVRTIEQLIVEHSPSIIFTHWYGDLNIDHQLTAKAVITATRPQLETCVRRLIAFEIPSSSEWSFGSAPHFNPNVFVNITESMDAKLKALNHYDSELRGHPHPRSLESLRANAVRLGGVAGYNFAEGFVQLRSLE